MNPYGLVADVHLHNWSSFSVINSDGQNSRLTGLLSEITRCASELHKAGGDTIVIAGDWFHIRGSVAPSVLNAAKDCLALCNQRFRTNFIVLAGNHDIEHKETTRLGSAVTALECEYVRTCDQIYIDAMLGVMLVPWIENIDALKEEIVALTKLDSYDHKEFDLILHAPIDGVIKGLPEHGLSPEWLGSLGFKRVAGGHYHNHKRFDGGVISIGALSHHTWSDIDTKAGFLLVYPDRVDWRKSHLPEFIDLSQLVDLNPDDIPFMVDKNYVRVKTDASKSKDIEAARKELLDMGAAAVIVQAMPKPPVREGSERATVACGGSLEVSVADFVRGMPGVPHEAVIKAALAVLATVNESEE